MLLCIKQCQASNTAKECFSPSKVKRWAVDDLSKTITWLESQDEKVQGLCFCYCYYYKFGKKKKKTLPIDMFILILLYLECSDVVND